MKISFKEIPGLSALFQDYIYDFEKIREFYNINPLKEEEYPGLFRELSEKTYHRDKLAMVLREQNKSFGNYENTINSINHLKRENTFVIFTGQQVGIFGGPLYTLYKAMTCINLARYLTMTTPYTFLPLFWVEGEDHDFEEVRKTGFINRDNKGDSLVWDPRIPFDGRCVGDIKLDSSISALIDRFSESVIDTDFKESIINNLKECYKPGETLAGAFSRWLTRLLGQYGLILVDPSHPKLKEMALPVYLKSLQDHDFVNTALGNASEKLKKSGYHAQVGHRPDTLDFFYHDPRRLPIIRDDGRYYIKKTSLSFTQDELKTLLEKEIVNFSPNVLLRPQVQDALFPTAVYVAGPGEIAYYAQFKGVYKVFDTPMPVIYPRKSLSIVEGRTGRTIKKYNISPKEIFGDPHNLEKRVLMEQVPEQLKDEMAVFEKTVYEGLDKVSGIARNFDPELVSVFANLRKMMDKDLSHGRSRVLSAFDKKDRQIRDQLEKVLTGLYPESALQERKLNILSFLYKYNLPLIYRLMERTCCSHDTGHLFWEVEL